MAFKSCKQALSKERLINVPMIQSEDFFFGNRNFQNGNSRQIILNRLNDTSKRRRDKG